MNSIIVLNSYCVMITSCHVSCCAFCNPHRQLFWKRCLSSQRRTLFFYPNSTNRLPGWLSSMKARRKLPLLPPVVRLLNQHKNKSPKPQPPPLLPPLAPPPPLPQQRGTWVQWTSLVSV